MNRIAAIVRPNQLPSLSDGKSNVRQLPVPARTVHEVAELQTAAVALSEQVPDAVSLVVEEVEVEAVRTRGQIEEALASLPASRRAGRHCVPRRPRRPAATWSADRWAHPAAGRACPRASAATGGGTHSAGLRHRNGAVRRPGWVALRLDDLFGRPATPGGSGRTFPLDGGLTGGIGGFAGWPSGRPAVSRRAAASSGSVSRGMTSPVSRGLPGRTGASGPVGLLLLSLSCAAFSRNFGSESLLDQRVERVPSATRGCCFMHVFAEHLVKRVVLVVTASDELRRARP